jgi:hypothetical protein
MNRFRRFNPGPEFNTGQLGAFPMTFVQVHRPSDFPQVAARAIDLSEAMHSVVCIDLTFGSVIVNPGQSLREIMECWNDLLTKNQCSLKNLGIAHKSAH